MSRLLTATLSFLAFTIVLACVFVVAMMVDSGSMERCQEIHSLDVCHQALVR